MSLLTLGQGSARRAAGGALGACLIAAPALGHAADYSLSGFGTLGWAQSDQPFKYQRYIDDTGTFKRDSVIGLQVDAKFANGFGATAQAKVAPATSNDRHYEASLAWAFASFRPNNDWLIRVGRQRIPIYLHSENYDVGATYDLARLPTEMYSLVPSNDFVGLSVGKTWQVAGELALDGYWGASRNDFRIWQRDDIASFQRTGAVNIELDFSGGGLVLSHKRGEQILRIGLHRALVKRHDGRALTASFPFVTLAPNIGYYQVDNALPGPGVNEVGRVANWTVAAGAELAMPAGVKLLSEFAYSRISNSDIAPQGSRGYVALSRRFGAWTPYASYAVLRSPKKQRALFDAVNANLLPDAVPGAAQINPSQRAGADQIVVFDQRSLAVGASYSFSPTSKIKTEIMRTRVGNVSRLADAPAGGNVRNQSINVFSLSYSVVF